MTRRTFVAMTAGVIMVKQVKAAPKQRTPGVGGPDVLRLGNFKRKSGGVRVIGEGQ